jgi:hypothetical protein
VKLGLLLAIALFAAIHATGAFMLAGAERTGPTDHALLVHHGD